VFLNIAFAYVSSIEGLLLSWGPNGRSVRIINFPPKLPAKDYMGRAGFWNHRFWSQAALLYKEVARMYLNNVNAAPGNSLTSLAQFMSESAFT
jgi:hypothetical protein